MSETEAAVVPELEQWEIHDVLSVERRYHVIRVLAEEGPQTHRELAGELVVRQGLDQTTRSSYQREYITLGQNHLPRLEDYGVIVEDGDHVEQGPNFAQVRSAMNAVALTRAPETIVDGREGEGE